MTDTTVPQRRTMSNKVPEVTVGFWLIKLLAVTVGETAADYMNLDLGLGLANTSLILGGVLILALALQLWQRRYIPWVYWLAVVLISVVGTLVSDNLVDNLGVALSTSTIAFAVILAIVFSSWYAVERTLSIHTIFTTRREVFYWLAILFTFALGTSAGDWVSEGFGFGYLETGAIFAAIIAAIALGYFFLHWDEILAFWLAYIFTRPLGASIGDWFAQDHEHGGLEFGTVGTSYIFLAAIAVLVVFMTVRRTNNGAQIAEAEPNP